MYRVYDENVYQRTFIYDSLRIHFIKFSVCTETADEVMYSKKYSSIERDFWIVNTCIIRRI